MKLDISPLKKALSQLEKSIGFLNSPLAASDPSVREQFRAAVIQAFEFTYEVGVKMIRRQLSSAAQNPQDIREMDFMDLMRTAHQAGLLRDPLAFRGYREMRNSTAHAYDENKAEQLLTQTGPFVQDMHFLLTALQSRNV